jgi:mannitol/fructose-specific phosphotransferase system IIA component (Ntr-type)
MKFADFICFEATVPDLRATDRNAAIAELVESLHRQGRIDGSHVRRITMAVVRRENEASTGLGKGVAIPHVKHKVVKDLVAAVGRSDSGIDFRSLDKRPVYTVILLISPMDNPERHLQAMKRIFNYLQQDKFMKFLRQSRTAGQIEYLFREADEKPDFG